jgi:hypothetical protein
VLVVMVLVEIFLLFFDFLTAVEMGLEIHYVFVPSFGFFLLAFLLC